MASGGRPRRITAEQAIELFTQVLDDSSDSFSNVSSVSDSDDDGDFAQKLVGLDLDLDQEVSSSSSGRSSPILSLSSAVNVGASTSRSSSTNAPSNAKKGRFTIKGKGKGKRTLSCLAPPTADNEEEDKDENDGETSTTWRQLTDEDKSLGTSQQYRFVPLRTPGPSPDIDASSSPFTCLQHLLTPAVVDNLLRSINEFAAQKVKINNPPKRRSVYASWVPVDREELYRFFMVMIVVGMDKRPRMRDYMTKTPSFWYTPWFYQVFPSRDRFLAIYHTMLHTGETGAQSKDKVEPFLNELIATFQEAFYPFKNLAIDEMIIGFKGRFGSKQFNASKPHKYHIKSFGLCDSISGYVYNLLLYFGKDTSYSPDTDPHSQQAVKVFQTLLTQIGKGHAVFADRYYTSLPVIRLLQTMKHHFTGTLMTNRKHFPTEIKNVKLKHKECNWYMTDEDDILCAAWRDKKAKKPCVLVSTNTTADMVPVTGPRGQTEKPAMVHEYNIAMNGCDKADQNISYYGPFQRRSKKWWKKIFFWLFEIAQFNAHILYTLSHPDQCRIEFRMFKQKLIEELEQTIVTLPVEPAKPVLIERHNKNAMHLVQYVDKDRNCVYCSTPQKRQRTMYVCSGCSDRPHLHPKHCFYAYHMAPRQ